MENTKIMSRRVSAGTRIYYMDVLKDKKGKIFLSISEIPTDKCPGKKKRQRIFIHSQNLEKFRKTLVEITELIKNDS